MFYNKIIINTFKFKSDEKVFINISINIKFLKY